MDFIEGLPKSGTYDVILVVADRLTKYAHFIPLRHPFTAVQVAKLFLDNVVKLHGVPHSIVSDQDRVFTGTFWHELFHTVGTKLNYSTTYHPQTDGQTERVNQCLKMYLRCAIHYCPKKWKSWLAMAEFWYNSSFHSSLDCSPFKALYGVEPNFGAMPNLSVSISQEAEELVKDRQAYTELLRTQLARAQNHMKTHADKNRHDRHFQVREQVLLKLQPYAQTSVINRPFPKLAFKYFGPFSILERIGIVAYKLQLPPDCAVHPVFHISQLKSFTPNCSPIFKDLSPLTDLATGTPTPVAILDRRTAIRARSPRARCPHLRTTLFRTLSLFSKMGAFPVFVVDGEPSPLKAQARAARFFRGSGRDLAALSSTEAEGDASVAAPVKGRNVAFTRYIEECVELLEYLGLPVLRADGEAEALCAQLDNEGHVDACITSDSDAFLFGAKIVIKVLRSNCREPFECYNIADIESGLGLKRKQMVAMAFLIGSDHDLHGMPGFGVETALRFVQLFDEYHILDKLYEIAKRVYPFLEGSDMPHIDDLPSPSAKSLSIVRSPHCLYCGHPGSKKNHIKVGCNYCLVELLENCMEKPAGFVCECPSCEKARNVKQRRHENWQIKVCKRIAAESNFPNEEIIKLYLSDDDLDKENGVLLCWNKPNVEALVDFLSYKQNWVPSYIRQQMFPMLSTIHLREVASSPSKSLLPYDQYEFHSIQRIKITHGHPYCLVKWKRATCGMISNGASNKKPELEGESDVVVIFDGDDDEATVICESTDLLDEPNIPQVLTDDKSCFLLTDEDIQLVNAAFPNEAQRFQEEQRLKEAKSRARKYKLNLANGIYETPKGPRSSGVQLSIKEFYRSKKGLSNESGKKLPGESQTAKDGSRKSSDVDLSKPKSIRRRLLFD